MVRGIREAHLRRYRLQVAVVQNQRRKLQTVRQAAPLMDRHLLVATNKGGGGTLVKDKEISGDLSINGEPDHRQCIAADLRCTNHRMAVAQACTVAALILHYGVDSVTQDHLQK